MAEYLNAVCSICGKKYHVCNDCSSTESFTPWRKIADSINCYKIFLALNAFTNGHTSKNETKNILLKCDLSNMESFEENIKRTIKKIMLENAAPKRRRASAKTSKAASKDGAENSSKTHAADNVKINANGTAKVHTTAAAE